MIEEVQQNKTPAGRPKWSTGGRFNESDSYGRTRRSVDLNQTLRLGQLIHDESRILSPACVAIFGQGSGSTSVAVNSDDREKTIELAGFRPRKQTRPDQGDEVPLPELHFGQFCDHGEPLWVVVEGPVLGQRRRVLRLSSNILNAGKPQKVSNSRNFSRFFQSFFRFATSTNSQNSFLRTLFSMKPTATTMVQEVLKASFSCEILSGFRTVPSVRLNPTEGLYAKPGP